MIDYNDRYIREHRFDGMTGLELESQRVTACGNLSHTPHPFPEDEYIDRDFGEAQIEISARAAGSVDGALDALHEELARLHSRLEENGELLWPFSNPPIVLGEDDIEIALYSGDRESSYEYRKYLARKYGKFKMTFSGIHFNYSFSDDVLLRGWELFSRRGGAGGSVYKDYREYKDSFYLRLAERVLEYSWVPVALLAASPVIDGSFYDAGRTGESVFTGFSTLRCSDFGYWNPFVPVISYEDIRSYTGSMRKYVESGVLIDARELYYPVRIKPARKYTLRALEEDGVDHIELRMVDLNPLADDETDIRDLRFLQLFLIWLSSLERNPLSENDQLTAIYNHKNSALYSWDIAQLYSVTGEPVSLKKGLSQVLERMVQFYSDDTEAYRLLKFQQDKIDNEERRYASIVSKRFGKDYIGEGLRRAREIQDRFNV